MKIKFGFLADDLLNEWDGYDYDATVAAYAAAVDAALKAAYPDAEIEIAYESGSGATPAPLKTAVDADGYWDTDHNEIPWVENIAARVYESFDWLREK